MRPNPLWRLDAALGSTEDISRDLVSGHAEMVRDIADDTGKRTDAKRFVARNGDIMLTVALCRQSQMAAGLSGHGVAEPAQRSG